MAQIKWSRKQKLKSMTKLAYCKISWFYVKWFRIQRDLNVKNLTFFLFKGQ